MYGFATDETRGASIFTPNSQATGFVEGMRCLFLSDPVGRAAGRAATRAFEWTLQLGKRGRHVARGVGQQAVAHIAPPAQSVDTLSDAAVDELFELMAAAESAPCAGDVYAEIAAAHAAKAIGATQTTLEAFPVSEFVTV